MLRPKTMTSRLVVWFLIIAIVPLVTASVVIYYQRAAATRAEAYSKLTAIRDLKIGKIDWWIEHRSGDLRAIAAHLRNHHLERILRHGGDDHDNLDSLRAALAPYPASYSDYRELLVIDPETGRTVVSTKPSREGMDRSKAPYFTEPMATGKLYISDVYFSPTEKIPVMEFSMPVFCDAHDGAHIAGVLAARVDLDKSLYQLLGENVGLGQTGETVLLDRAGVVLNELRLQHHEPLELTWKTGVAALAIAGREGTVEAKDYRGTETLIAYSHLRSTGWGFLVKQDLAELYAPITTMIWQIAVAVLALAMLVVVAAVLVAKSTTRPVREIARVAQRIRNGEVDVRCAIVTTTELAAMGQSINDMADALVEQAAELQARNRELAASNLGLERQSEELRRQADQLRQLADELELRRAQIEEAGRLKSEFLSNMSHELRTPLNSILALSQLMLARGPTPDKDGEALRVIERNGRELLTLINDILDLSRIEAGRLNLDVAEVDPLTLVHDAVDTIRPAAEAKRLSLEVRGHQVPAIESDGNRIRQILLNLLSNAVKFTDRGGISVTVSGDEDRVRFAVRDTGIGVRPEDREIIFDQFRQADGTSTRQHGGSGLGLAICDKLAKLIGGEVTLVSEVGEGSTFTLDVPRRGGPVSGRLAADGEPVVTVVMMLEGEGAKDELNDFLRRNGQRVAVASDGEEGVRMARALQPRAVVLDVALGGGDRWALLRELKATEATRAIPVVVATGDPEDRSSALTHGAAACVVKPIDRDQLLRVLSSLTG